MLRPSPRHPTPGTPGTAVAAVLFDLDGTLIDTMGAFADVAARVMARWHGADVATARARYLETSGIPFRQQLEVIYPGHAANQHASDLFEHDKRGCADRAVMDDRTIAGLRRLRAAGLGLIVSSNGAQHFVDDFARRADFAFDLVLGHDAATGLAKGRPHVERACARLGVGPERLLFCGDSIKDGELAHACGVAFVGRLGTFSSAAFRAWDPSAVVVDDVYALADLVEGSRVAA